MGLTRKLTEAFVIGAAVGAIVGYGVTQHYPGQRGLYLGLLTCTSMGVLNVGLTFVTEFHKPSSNPILKTRETNRNEPVSSPSRDPQTGQTRNQWELYE